MFEELLGKTLISVDIHGIYEIIFTCTDNTSYKMYHAQDCCERVSIEEIIGNWEDILSFPILLAEEVSNADGPRPDMMFEESYTWTFYKLATNRGYITLRWLGQSNGYYSEHVDFVQINE